MRKVLFIQVKFPRNSSEIAQLLSRWESYAKVVSEISNERISVYSFTRKFGQKKSTSLDFAKLQGKELRFESEFSQLMKEISRFGSSYTVICGDNQISLLLGLLLKFRFKSSIRLQIQFHGDTYSFAANKGLVGSLRVLMSRLGIRFADSIRVVSKFQVDEIERLSKYRHQEFVVAPIPINFLKLPKGLLESNFDVILVGRLHAERGTSEIVRILDALNQRSSDLRVGIAGTGPEERWMKSILGENHSGNSVQFLGLLNELELRDLYSRSKILLSTAPQEGYGLSLREAALSGLNVIAKKSRGAEEAVEVYGESIRLYENQDQAVKMIIETLIDPAQVSVSALRNIQKSLDEKSVRSLVKSWLND